jgi:hypothetical protein
VLSGRGYGFPRTLTGTGERSSVVGRGARGADEWAHPSAILAQSLEKFRQTV